MNSGWQDIATAPLGRYVTSAVKTKDGDRERVDFKPDWIWSYRASDRHMTQTYWLPKEDRWNGYTKEQAPTHWHVFKPEPPNA